MASLVLLLALGVIAFGLPHQKRSADHRLWYDWVHGGLLPLLIGYFLSWPFTDADVEVLHPLLLLVMTTAGVLTGTQLRFAYLHRAGAKFIGRHTALAGVTALGVTIPMIGLLFFVFDVSLGLSVAWGCVAGAMAVATNQRKPLDSADFNVGYRDVLFGHIAPTGWWNLCALFIAGWALSWLVEPELSSLRNLPIWMDFILSVFLAIFVGLVLGWLAIGCGSLFWCRPMIHPVIWAGWHIWQLGCMTKRSARALPLHKTATS